MILLPFRENLHATKKYVYINNSISLFSNFYIFFQSAFESCHKDIRYERANRARQKDKEGKIDVMHHFQLRSDPETRAEKTAFEPVKKKKKIAPNPNLHPAEVLKNSYFI